MRRIWACLPGACLLGCALALAQPAGAQPNLSQRTGITIADTGVEGYRFDSIQLQSAQTGQRYRLRVAIPQRPAAPAGYPVAWMLDGNAALMDLDAAVLQRLAKSSSAPVLVFVAHDNDLRIDGGARAYDYTPRRPGGDEAQRDSQGERCNGGADALLDLIAGPALRGVAALAPVDPARQALWGHSYGGVFVLHALFTRPQAFASYGAADPSLWWGEGYLLREEAQAIAWTGVPPRLQIWQGSGGASATQAAQPRRDSEAAENMRRARQSVPPDAAAQMAQRLRARGMTVDFQELPGLSHGQTLGASLPLFLAQFLDASLDVSP